MTIQSRYSKAERFGHWLGGGWQAYRQRERQTVAQALERGVPRAIAIGGLWLVRLLIMGGLLYVAFWVGLLVAVLVLVAWMVCRPLRSENEKPEWRMGWSGFGLYSGETRIDNDEPEN
ncbi:DUF3742 family protein [Pseudomonas flexibilis]|uniref:DUF3742 family protein n=1 Tax=Pseudomonas flexibilis TaxID=706570 RepID=UPI000876866A|nr:DUF3742 family protein [Pseudomonas flexibilis]SCY12604.1 Protein of unknown function [Pseudomonas flexibilis]